MGRILFLNNFCYRFSRVCVAARRALAFVECSTTQEQKKLFIQWNTAYYQFRLIVRHVMNGITNVFVSKYTNPPFYLF